MMQKGCYIYNIHPSSFLSVEKSIFRNRSFLIIPIKSEVLTECANMFQQAYARVLKSITNSLARAIVFQHTSHLQ